ncbi:hypothetical protein Anapl_15871 [Anas platyrhynchos]|uniref:Uncharacterized protein n=1 Tax=Anas platyrhynchos TaxID=8839 RepID=R0JWZ8_ANAPL|nr:hypothetical protein Anapl_15871 [Anas platyrhynchos]
MEKAMSEYHKVSVTTDNTATQQVSEGTSEGTVANGEGRSRAAYRYGKFTSFSTLFKGSFEESTEYKSWEGDSELYTLLLIPGNMVTINNALLQGIISLYKTILLPLAALLLAVLVGQVLDARPCPYGPQCVAPATPSILAHGSSWPASRMTETFF